MTCYSDHNEDIRTKGSCDLCGGTEPDGPRIGVVRSSELGDDWTAGHHLGRRELPGDRPEEVGPSGVYGWRRVDPLSWETEGPVVQVVESTNGKQWIATPARYYAETAAQMTRGLAIDAGMGWHLPREDVEPFVAFARRVQATEPTTKEN